MLLLAVAILLFSFMLRVPTADQAILGILERQSFDVQVNFLRHFHPRPAKVEPVLIGIDESAEDSFDEPIAMWHRHFAALDSAPFKGCDQCLGEQFVSEIPESVIPAERNAELPFRPHSVTNPPYLYQRGMITKRRKTILIIPSSTPVHNPLNCLNRIKKSGVWKWQKLFTAEEKPMTVARRKTSR